MTPTEVSDLRYMAIESSSMPNLHRSESGFHRALKSLTGLREFYIVYDLRKENERRNCLSVSCTTLCEDVPYGFSGRGQRRVSKMLEEDNWDIASSSTYKCCRVYGIKQCNCTHLESESGADMYDDSGSDDDDDIHFFPGGDHWGFTFDDYEYDDDMFDPTGDFF
jgi:hypothetical protein